MIFPDIFYHNQHDVNFNIQLVILLYFMPMMGRGLSISDVMRVCKFFLMFPLLWSFCRIQMVPWMDAWWPCCPRWLNSSVWSMKKGAKLGPTVVWFHAVQSLNILNVIMSCLHEFRNGLRNPFWSNIDWISWISLSIKDSLFSRNQTVIKLM